MIKVFSTFSGAGGLDLRFHQSSDFDVIGHCEVNKYASAVLNYHYPTVRNYGDITKINLDEVPAHHCLIGGFPCTDISTQGKQKGIRDGEKSGLYNYLLPIIDAKKPLFLLFENVKNLLSKQMEGDLNYVKQTIADRGYNFRIFTIDSSDYGTVQQRVRVFILAIRQDIEFRESDFGNVFKRTHQSQGHALNKNAAFISWSKSTRKTHTDYRIRTDGRINTLTTGKGCKGASTGTLVIENNVVRDLSPEECEQLMCWPIGHTQHGLLDGEEIIISNSQRYRLCGNGVVANCTTPFLEIIKNLYNRYTKK